MGKEPKIICKSIFKNSSKTTMKSEFNERFSKLICRAENLSLFKRADWRDKK